MYLRVTDQGIQYPYLLWKIVEDFPNTSFPQPFESCDLTLFGVYVVTPSNKPEVDPLSYKVEEVAPALLDGEYLQQWSVLELTADEKAARINEQREANLLKAKELRRIAVDNIKVTTSSGKEFDGDETSQNRMDRAIRALGQAGVSVTTWVLANNEPTQVSLEELQEALTLAGAAQTAIWMTPWEAQPNELP